MLGLLEDYRLAVETGFTANGSWVYLLGETFAELGGSEFAEVVLGSVRADLPPWIWNASEGSIGCWSEARVPTCSRAPTIAPRAGSPSHSPNRRSPAASALRCRCPGTSRDTSVCSPSRRRAPWFRSRPNGRPARGRGGRGRRPLLASRRDRRARRRVRRAVRDDRGRGRGRVRGGDPQAPRRVRCLDRTVGRSSVRRSPAARSSSSPCSPPSASPRPRAELPAPRRRHRSTCVASSLGTSSR